MAKNYFNRYVWLIDTINRHGYISFSHLSNIWECCGLNNNTGRERELPERTFFNHVKAIEDIFGIKIKCNRSLGYYIANDEDLDGGDIRQWLLESLSLNNLLNESHGMRNQILIEKIPSSQHWLQVLVNAIKDKKTVEMTYQSYSRVVPDKFEAHPWCLKLFKQRWYLLAKTGAYKEPRVYAFDRIHDIQETANALNVPERFDAREFFSNFYGIIVDDSPLETIRLKVDADQTGYFKSLPLHDTQKEIESTEEYTIFEYRLVPTFDFKQEILSKGPSVEVLSPESFREEIHADIKAMIERYDRFCGN